MNIKEEIERYILRCKYEMFDVLEAVDIIFNLKNEWFSVKDKLPEIGQVCLLYQTWPQDTMFNCRADPLRRVHMRLGGLRYNSKFVSYEDQWSEEGLKHVSHW